MKIVQQEARQRGQLVLLLSKPYGMTDLLDKVEEALNGHRSSEAG